MFGSAIAGAALTAFGLPAGFLLGPMIVAATLAMSVGGPALSPRAFDAAQAVIGLMIARTITWPILAEIGHEWPVFAAGVVSVIAVSLAIGWLLMRWQVLPGPTALWGTSPGAAVAMVLMSPAYGADERLVAFMQYLRVVIVATAASILGAFAAPDRRTPSGFAAWVEPLPAMSLIASLALCVSAYLVGRRLSMPAAPLIVAIVIGAFAQDTGLVTITLPEPLLALSFTLVGWGIGLRFTRQTLAHALRALPAITGAIALLILVCGGIAYLMVRLAGVDPLTAYLATSPGGADTVAIIASATHVDVAYVMAMQLARFLAVMVTGPPLARLMTRWAGYTSEPAER
ncbi:membrane protein [Salinisphaera sp. T31B1]